MLDVDLAAMRRLVERLNYQPLFVTVSGAHLYGFPSSDSDVDLRGCHLLPLRDVVGLDLPNQTLEHKTIDDGTEVELVSHDAGKYLNLLVRNNGYVLEQIFSPIVVLGQEFLGELRPLAQRCITRHHYHHYRGFYATQRKLIAKELPKRAKPILYAYRVLMTGIHLLMTGEVEANLLRLNELFGFGFLEELIARKVDGENTSVGNLDWAFHEARLTELEAQLAQAFQESKLPEERDRRPVNELLILLRLGISRPDVPALGLIHRRSGNPAQTQRLGPYTIESLINRPEEGRATVYRVSIVPHQRTRISYHRVAEECYFVLRGHGTAVLDGQEYRVEAGDFLRLPPGTTHGFITGDEPLEMLNVHAPGCRPDHDTYFADGEPPDGFATDKATDQL
jgi:predicted nucleotidyltransferase/quercetin dioxygenase-like cupin family protein